MGTEETDKILKDTEKVLEEQKDIPEEELPQDIILEEEDKPNLDEQGVESLPEYEKLEEKEQKKYGI